MSRFVSHNIAGTSRTYPSNICNSCDKLVRFALFKLVSGPDAWLDLDLAALSFLADQLNQNWGLRVQNIAEP